MVVSQGILTSTGGMTSHAAVVARGMGTPCIAGAKEVFIRDRQVVIGGETFNEGDWITIDGSTGNVYKGQLPLVAPNISQDMSTFLEWCDEIRAQSVRGTLKGFEVRTNADQPEDAKRAFDFGAQGVGLCRTEHMFFDKEKLIHFQAMIVADTSEERKDALGKILPLQQRDFFGIFKAMEGRPVTIRLLDPPLHEFVPHTGEEVGELAEYLGVEPRILLPKIENLHEANPMLGHRGCRLAVTYPEIYDMQVEAIARAAVECVQEQIPVNPEIMIPIVITARELKLLRPNAEAIIARVLDEAGVKLDFKIGTMIEVPRAAIRAGHIAKYADFFSFGTNDLTQMTFAFSRDDVASFLPTYLKKQVLDVDPFKSIDEEGVGFLIQNAVEQGRSVNPRIKVGICGEHGGDPRTIDFCFRAGLSYVSCSPYRVPLARLAGAQAVINNSGAAAKSGKTSSPSRTAKTKAAGAKPAGSKAVKAAEKPVRGRARAADKPVKAAVAAEKAPRGRARVTDKPAKAAVAVEKAPRGRARTADKPAKAAKSPKTVKKDLSPGTPKKRGLKPKKA
jgi:pyruvate,orthophosphate dikinase